MKEETREYLHSPKLYLGILIGAVITAVLGAAAAPLGAWAGILVAGLIAGAVAVVIADPPTWTLSMIAGGLTGIVAGLLCLIFGGFDVLILCLGAAAGVLGGVIGHYIRTSHTMMNVFHSPRFVVGFTIISIIVLATVFYPMFDTRDPMYSYGDIFMRPGTYFSVYDANLASMRSTTVHRVKNPNEEVLRWDSIVPVSERETAIRFLARKYCWEQGYVVVSNTDASGKPRDIEAYKANKIAQAEKEVEDAQKRVNELQAKLDDPNTKDAQKRAIERSQMPAAQEALATAQAKLEKYSDKIITVDKAVELWTEEYHLTTDAKHLPAIRALWVQEYEALINDEDVPEGFANGKGFIYNAEGGMELGASYTTLIEATNRDLRIDPTQDMYFVQGAGSATAMAAVAQATGAEVEVADETVAPAEVVDEALTEAEETEAAATDEVVPPAEELLAESETPAEETAEPVEETADDAVEAVLAEVQIEDDTVVTRQVGLTNYVTVGDVSNSVTFTLGTDNNGRDVLLLLITAAGKSLLIGLLAGSIATVLGLIFGLLAGYVGGIVDDVLSFIMNIFTVIPGFVLMILIYNMVDKSQRGIIMCGTIIGVTSWVWTARSVRSQVISLRNRDHVNLSKLSGHSLVRIILTDILPYIASYVVMAFILQVSSGILAEAQLSILGLGPSMTDGSTLGLMMNWAKLFGAYTSSNAWWAYFPVIGTIALISFSLNLMNTGLDQVFNPTLRD